MRILVVDDSPLCLEVLTAALEQVGHAVVAASNAPDALPLLPYVDACICDGLNGACWDVLDRCKLLHVPCVLYSGDSDKCDQAEAMGVPGVLKPAPIKMVLAKLGREVGMIK